MTEEEYQQEKKKILALSKNKGLDLWEKVFEKYDIDIEQVKSEGVYVKELGGYIVLYFDTEKDQWLIRQICQHVN